MSLLAQRRAFLLALRKHGTPEATMAALGLPPDTHNEWMKDWLYRGAFMDVCAEMRKEAAAGAKPAPAPKVPKRIGRPPKPKPENPPPKRPMGRPRKYPLPAPAEAPNIAAGSPDEPAPAPVEPGGTSGAPAPEPAVEAPATEPPPEPIVIPSLRGYTRLYVPDEELRTEVSHPPEPKPPRKETPVEEPLEITVASDERQRAMVDEYGELDRRMQLRATDTARYESLKKAIKTWFKSVPPDADGTVEGDVYLLHLSACERERKIRSLAELVERIGLEKLLELVELPIGRLENLLGKDNVEPLIVETRSGSRRIKAIPKRAAAIAG